MNITSKRQAPKFVPSKSGTKTRSEVKAPAATAKAKSVRFSLRAAPGCKVFLTGTFNNREPTAIEMAINGETATMPPRSRSRPETTCTSLWSTAPGAATPHAKSSSRTPTARSTASSVSREKIEGLTHPGALQAGTGTTRRTENGRVLNSLGLRRENRCSSVSSPGF